MPGASRWPGGRGGGRDGTGRGAAAAAAVLMAVRRAYAAVLAVQTWANGRLQEHETWS